MFYLFFSTVLLTEDSFGLTISHSASSSRASSVSLLSKNHTNIIEIIPKIILIPAEARNIQYHGSHAFSHPNGHTEGRGFTGSVFSRLKKAL